MKKYFLNESQVKEYAADLIRQMGVDGYKPDIVIGLTRGGLVPANLISQYFNVPMIAVNKNLDIPQSEILNKKVLVVDDINDTGETLTQVNNLLFDVFVKYATLVTNLPSPFEVDYSAKEINKVEDPSWIVFPWENWWKPHESSTSPLP